RMVSSTREQKGHWKSENSTRVTRALFGPKTGELPTGIRSESCWRGPFVAPSSLTDGCIPVVVIEPTTKPRIAASMIDIAAAPLLIVEILRWIEAPVGVSLRASRGHRPRAQGRGSAWAVRSGRRSQGAAADLRQNT